MKEDDYINVLLEAARREQPRLSYDKVARHFERVSSPTYLEQVKVLLQGSCKAHQAWADHKLQIQVHI